MGECWTEWGMGKGRVGHWKEGTRACSRPGRRGGGRAGADGFFFLGAAPPKSRASSDGLAANMLNWYEKTSVQLNATCAAQWSVTVQTAAVTAGESGPTPGGDISQPI